MDTEKLRAMARLRRAFLTMSPARTLMIGYLSYMLLGWALLSLPWAQAVPVAAIDTLFISTSAVSTTGLVSVDPGSSFTFFGELVILALIQMGGLGYMTVGSFATLAIQSRMTRVQEHAARAGFHLPDEINPRLFIRAVVFFTLIAEAIGAAVLYAFFVAEGVEDPLWSAIFHAISAFCTAGFSLNSSSFEAFGDHPGILLTLSVLSLAGAMGFLIVVDAYRTLMGRATALGFTSKVIVRITLAFLVLGTLFLFVAEPSIADKAPSDRLLAAFFQTMTASTTVGFNSEPIGGLSTAVLLVLIFLMVIGASPAGTGGGLRTTSFAALVGLVRSTVKGRDRVRFFKRRVPLDSLQTATASLAYYMMLLLVTLTLLTLTEPGARFEALLFETVSAMGTVGLSMGVTGELSDLGKLLITILMTAGRVGILTFGVALASRDESRDEERDNTLVV